MSNYPSGKLCENDEGELEIAIHSKDKIIIIEFNKKIKWFGLNKNEAVNLVKVLLAKVNEI
jgi:hypothetical protein